VYSFYTLGIILIP
ncbi:hypothetical protein MPH_14111, partial [Macrophomina phaseolina MS6]